MHKPSPSRMNLITSIAAAIGLSAVDMSSFSTLSAVDMSSFSTAEVLRKHRGPAPAGKKWRDSNVYLPGGANPNVEPTKVRNPKIAAQVNAMHEKWAAVPRTRVFQEPDPHSLTSIKIDLHCTRSVARMVKERVAKKAEAAHAPA